MVSKAISQKIPKGFVWMPSFFVGWQHYSLICGCDACLRYGWQGSRSILVNQHLHIYFRNKRALWTFLVFILLTEAHREELAAEPDEMLLCPVQVPQHFLWEFNLLRQSAWLSLVLKGSRMWCPEHYSFWLLGFMDWSSVCIVHRVRRTRPIRTSWSQDS